MPYSNDSSVTIRTILTPIGKLLLSKGQFVPAKFAVVDTGVDYGLYIANDPPTEADGAVILSIPIPLQTLTSPFYPLFSSYAGRLTTNKMILKGNASTSFALNSNKQYEIIPLTQGMVLKYRMYIGNTRYFSNKFSSNSSYTATILALMFTLNTISDITKITDIYGTTFQLSIIGLTSGAQLNIDFTLNVAGE